MDGIYVIFILMVHHLYLYFYLYILEELYIIGDIGTAIYFSTLYLYNLIIFIFIYRIKRIVILCFGHLFNGYFIGRYYNTNYYRNSSNAFSCIYILIKCCFTQLLTDHPISCLALSFTTRWVNSSRQKGQLPREFTGDSRSTIPCLVIFLVQQVPSDLL